MTHRRPQRNCSDVSMESATISRTDLLEDVEHRGINQLTKSFSGISVEENKKPHTLSKNTSNVSMMSTAIDEYQELDDTSRFEPTGQASTGLSSIRNKQWYRTKPSKAQSLVTEENVNNLGPIGSTADQLKKSRRELRGTLGKTYSRHHFDGLSGMDSLSSSYISLSGLSNSSFNRLHKNNSMCSAMSISISRKNSELETIPDGPDDYESREIELQRLNAKALSTKEKCEEFQRNSCHEHTHDHVQNLGHIGASLYQEGELQNGHSIGNSESEQTDERNLEERVQLQGPPEPGLKQSINNDQENRVNEVYDNLQFNQNTLTQENHYHPSHHWTGYPIHNVYHNQGRPSVIQESDENINGVLSGSIPNTPTHVPIITANQEYMRPPSHQSYTELSPFSQKSNVSSVSTIAPVSYSGSEYLDPNAINNNGRTISNLSSVSETESLTMSNHGSYLSDNSYITNYYPSPVPISPIPLSSPQVSQVSNGSLVLAPPQITAPTYQKPISPIKLPEYGGKTGSTRHYSTASTNSTIISNQGSYLYPSNQLENQEKIIFSKLSDEEKQKINRRVKELTKKDEVTGKSHCLYPDCDDHDGKGWEKNLRLKTHIESAHLNIVHKCDFCEKTCSRHDNLKKHMLSKHGKEIKAKEGNASK